MAGIGWLPNCKRMADGMRKCVRAKETRSVKAGFRTVWIIKRKGGPQGPLLLCRLATAWVYVG